MELFHVTRAVDLPSIRATGLVVKRSKGKLPVVWMVERERLEWAWIHVAAHQCEPTSQMIALPVSVERDQLTYRGRSVWISLVDVSPHLIGDPISLNALILAEI